MSDRDDTLDALEFADDMPEMPEAEYLVRADLHDLLVAVSPVVCGFASPAEADEARAVFRRLRAAHRNFRMETTPL